MIAMRALRRVLLVLPMLALAACNTVGEGNKIETLQIKDAIYGFDLPSLQVSQCLRYNLAAVGVFTDGSSGVYTDRATWSSSNEAIARVSNGDILLPSDSTKAYAKGTVIPVSAGSATITVDYVGVKANLTVTVAGTIPTITLQPYTTILPRPASASSNLTIAPRTVQSYAALATLNGRVTDVTGAARWSVLNPNTSCVNTNTANLTCDPVEYVTGAFSSFRAKRLDDSQNPIAPANTTSKTIQADFNSLTGTSCPIVQATLGVAPFDSTVPNPIAIVSEFDTSGTKDGSGSALGQIPALFVGTTDRLKAYATLRDTSSAVYTQDVSELGATGDGTTAVMGYGLPIIPSTDTSSNFTVVTNTDGTTTTTDCRSKDLVVFSFTSTGLLNFIYSAASDDANPVGDGNVRNFYANFVTKPSTTTSSATVTCPDGTTQISSITSDAASVSSAKFARQTRTGTLTAIDICAVGPSTPVNSCANPGSTTLLVSTFPQYPEDSARVQLRAIGHFTPASGPSDIQDITPSVTWTSTNTGVISIIGGGSSPTQAGLASSILPGTVTVTATYTKDSVTTTSNTLTMVAQ